MTAGALETAQALYTDGDLTGATEAFHTALADGADESQCRLGLGLIAIDQEQSDKAIAHLKAAIAADRNNGLALTALGAAFIQANLPAKAATVLMETVRQHPRILDARLYLAKAFNALERFTDALSVITASLELFQDSAQLWRLRGETERRAGLIEQAYDSFLRLHDLSPEDANTWNDLGVICRALGRYKDAEHYYRQAIERNPNLAVAHANLGNVLERQDQTEAAEEALRAALKLKPNDADAAYNLAAVLSKLERPDDAIPLLETLTEASPERWDAWTNLGVARLDCGDVTGAETALREALEINPDNPEAHYNLAWLLLLTDRHAEGWQKLEWRWQLEDFSSHQRDFACPPWAGEPLDNRTLLLHAEQGFGDTIQFCRFAASIPKQRGRVILECQPALVSLLGQLPGIDDVIPAGDPLPSADVQAPLLSLPTLVHYDGTRTSDSAGYLRAPVSVSPDLVVPNNGKQRIGLVWAGSPDNKIERRRHIEVDMFPPVFESADADFVSLQTGPRSTDFSHQTKDPFTFACEGVVRDFSDTATVINQLDLVIGVDTAVMHLTGALGKPGWILLPFMPDYRWGLGRDTTPWYDSLRLFRQPERGTWSAVVADVCAALRSW